MRNLEYADILKRVKEILWDGLHEDDANEYICDCIGSVTGVEDHTLCDIIADRIDNEFSIKNWLINRGQATHRTPMIVIQAYRQRWLDSMIAEFSQE